ncbi:hypothetical protein ACSBOB_19425 [Mesorhizobium sp. ASY16-5R]|uniref:hypothetical protein n=1 Tax=Mesorhizobium sp. ASY16-5R TaxID=3445772 RepID=UPI003FA094EA
MRLLVPTSAMLALVLLSACQSAPPSGKRFEPECTPRRYDAGFCDLPSNFHLWTTLLTGQVQ